MTIQEIADHHSVSYNTARKWVREEMPHFRSTDGTIRVYLEDYEDWKASKRIDPREPKPEVAA